MGKKCSPSRLQLERDIIRDSVQWDVRNWSRSLEIWEEHILHERNLRCLEIGSARGGLSLWLASMGQVVLCSDLYNPEKKARSLHERYGVSDRISYGAVNVFDIPYEDYFDVVIFKSVLGGLGRNLAAPLKAVGQMHKALKPGGKLFFAENLAGSPVHGLFRRLFVPWGNRWRYLRYDEIETVFAEFSALSYTTMGFWGTFGKNEVQKDFLARADRVFEHIVSKKYRYIVTGVARK